MPVPNHAEPAFGLGLDTLYVWAENMTEARRTVKTYLKEAGIPPQIGTPVAKWIGATQPGGYDFTGNATDGYTETVGTTLRRYSVKL